MTLLGSSLTLLQGTGKYVQKYLLGGSVYAKWVNVFSLPFWNLSSRFLENGAPALSMAETRLLKGPSDGQAL